VPIPPVRRVYGYRNDRAFRPFDPATGSFAPGIALGAIDGYGWIGAEYVSLGPSPGAAVTLLQHTPLEMLPSGIGVARARYELLRLMDLGAPDGGAVRTTLRGDAVYVDGTTVITLEPVRPLGDDGAAVAALAHRLRLADDGAHVEQTVELPAGHLAHAWSQRRGYVLLAPDDRCAATTMRVVALRLQDGVLGLDGELELPGTRWRIGAASDELLVLSRDHQSLTQHAPIAARAAGLSLRGFEAAPNGTPTGAFRDRFVLGR
jgi:hypothetical protein